MKHFIYTLLLGCFSTSSMWSQKVLDQEAFSIDAAFSTSSMTIDGMAMEGVWQSAKPSGDFWMKFPRQDERPIRQTEVRVAYDEQNLYFFAKCYDTSFHIIRSLKRDTRIRENDGFVVVIDPVNKSTYGYEFGVLANGVQNEAIIIPFSDDPDFAFDQKWYSATKIYADHYTVEMQIPLRILRYESGNATWGVNFIRSDQKNNQFSTWTRMPVQVRGFDLLYTGALRFDNPPKKLGLNGAVIPYVSGSVAQDLEDRPDGSLKTPYNGGLDAKVGVTSSLNLDLTLNPDFSQVDADVQQTNLTRFDLFYPERRNFFIENSDVFSSFGIPPVRPFFSRRIGLDANNMPVPILFGARLSGNVSDKTRIGVMNMQTRATGDSTDRVAENYSVAAFNHNFDGFNSLKGIVMNRSGIHNGEFSSSDYGRNVGFEFVGNDKNNRWQKWASYHHSFKQGVPGRESMWGAGFFYNAPKAQILVDYSDVGTAYYADMGLILRIENYDAERDSVIRLGFRQNYVSADFFIFPKNKSSIINRHNPGFEDYTVLNPDFSFNEHMNRLRYFLSFNNTAELRLRLDFNQVNVMFPFALISETPLPAQLYRFNTINFEGNTDTRKLISFSGSVTTGGFYNGRILTAIGGINFRKQPWGILEVRAEYNRINFPDPYGSGEIWLVGPKFDISLSRTMFWTTFLQYNTQANNFNINSRLQWRYAPMSDLFLVYTDNYATTPFGPKNRALVLKLNYWLTL